MIAQQPHFHLMVYRKQPFPQYTVCISHFRCVCNSFFLSFLFFITGRLHQVEYAIEAINNAGTAVGILASDGIVLAGVCERERIFIFK